MAVQRAENIWRDVLVCSRTLCLCLCLSDVESRKNKDFVPTSAATDGIQADVLLCAAGAFSSFLGDSICIAQAECGHLYDGSDGAGMGYKVRPLTIASTHRWTQSCGKPSRIAYRRKACASQCCLCRRLQVQWELRQVIDDLWMPLEFG